MSLVVAFSPDAWKDYTGWADAALVKRINLLIKDNIQRGNERDGLGEPEKLSGDLAGWYTRRITKEHRLVFQLRHGMVFVASCRYRYMGVAGPAQGP